MQATIWKPWMTITVVAGISAAGFLGGCTDKENKPTPIRSVSHQNARTKIKDDPSKGDPQIQHLQRGMKEAHQLFKSFWVKYWGERNENGVNSPFWVLGKILDAHLEAGKNGQLQRVVGKCPVGASQVTLTGVEAPVQSPTPTPAPKPGTKPKVSPRPLPKESLKIGKLKVGRSSDCRATAFQDAIEVTWSSKTEMTIKFDREYVQDGFGRQLFAFSGRYAACRISLRDDGKLRALNCTNLGQDHGTDEFMELIHFGYNSDQNSLFSAKGSKYRIEPGNRNGAFVKNCEEKGKEPCIEVYAVKGDPYLEIFENTVTEDARRAADRAEAEANQPPAQPPVPPLTGDEPPPIEVQQVTDGPAVMTQTGAKIFDPEARNPVQVQEQAPTQPRPAQPQEEQRILYPQEERELEEKRRQQGNLPKPPQPGEVNRAAPGQPPLPNYNGRQPVVPDMGAQEQVIYDENGEPVGTHHEQVEIPINENGELLAEPQFSR